MTTSRGNIILFLNFLFLSLSVSGQEGNPVLKNYYHTTEEADHLNICIKQNVNGIMLFANSKGLLSFDGKDWKLFATENIPLIIEPDSRTNKIFAGFYQDYGYFQKEENGTLSFITYDGDQNFKGEIHKILTDEEYVYFCNQDLVIKIDKTTDREVKRWNKMDSPFTGFLLHQGKLYVNQENKGLNLLQDQGFSEFPEGKIFKNAEILFSFPLDKNTSLIGSSMDELHILHGNQIKKLKTESEIYLKSNYLTDGINLGNNLVALSTLTGGFIIIEISDGRTIHTLNTSSGLPDNEVYAIGKDNHGGLWVSHHYGISRMDPHLPFKEFSSYPGLKGNILSTTYFDKTLYVATSEGLFYLSKNKNGFQSETTLEKQKDLRIENRKGVHHLIDQVFHKRKIKKTEEPIRKGFRKNSTHPIEKTNYTFYKIDGISAKCRQLIVLNDRILVGTNKGLFEINDKKSRQIISDEYINCIYQENDGSFLVGLRHGLLYLSRENQVWNIKKIFHNEFNIYSITKGQGANYWAGSNGKVIRLEINKDKKLIDKEIFHLPDFHNEQILARTIFGVPTFFISDGVFYYNSSENKILKDPKLYPKGTHYRFNACQNNITWYKNEEGWKGLLSTFEKKDISIPYLSFFKNIRHIYLEKEGYAWILDASNSLYRLTLDKPIEAGLFDLHIHEIKSNEGQSLPIKDLSLNHDANSIHFSLSAPFYLDESSVQYSYFVEGLMNEWSPWSKDNRIELTYLPVGEHIFHARARNGLGQISDLEKVTISIRPPYWKTLWFFTIEVIFFLSLIIISILLNRTNRSRFLTKAITFLTLILVVEFIVYQLENVITVGNSENPIIRFSFNVMLALMISPVEKILEITISKKRRKIAKLMLIWRKTF